LPSASGGGEAASLRSGAKTDEAQIPSAGPASSISFVEGEAATLEGSLETIVFRNTREGFTVADFLLDDGRRIKVVGALADATLGVPLILSGDFERDPRFGLQFRVVGTIDPEASEEVALAYLSSGLIPYIGEAGAAEIVAACGADTLRILATRPESLLDYRGITAKRLPKIRKALRETLSIAPIVGLLNYAVANAKVSGRDARKLPVRVARRIARHYGAGAAELIRANPWRLSKEIIGVGFLSADNLAIGLGCPLDSPTRIEAAVLESLRIAAVSSDNTDEGGHIYLPASVLEARAASMAAVGQADAASAIARLCESGEIEEIKSHHGFAIPRLAEAERLIAAKLRVIAAFADASPISVSEGEIDEIERSENEALMRFSRLSDTNPSATYAAAKALVEVSSDPAEPALGDPGPSAPVEHFKFDSSQRRAIRKALEDRITIITGQPGTGKTTLVRAILDLADAHGLSSALVSPTGRAAKRLSEATGRPAQTIHRFLRYHPDRGFEGPDMLPDVCVVDEVSMLDSLLASKLIGALPPYVRLILVGDEDQLPAVGPGNVLGDLLGAPTVNVLRLTTIHRTAKGSGVPELAHQIRMGVREPKFDHASTRWVRRGEDKAMKPAEQGQEIADWIGATLSKYTERIDEFQILCPMKKGACGTEALNRLVQGIVNPGPHVRSLRREGFTLYPGDRVLVTKNDYPNQLFNGDVGKLTDITPDGQLVVNFDGVERTLPPDAGGGMTLAYAITVHKSQGSEFPIVLLPMHTSFFIMLKRRLLYTAVSRARKTVTIIGQAKAISMAIGNHDPRARRTLLLDYLTARDAPPMPLVTPEEVPEDELF
jgi:exodeoxyribonuclease V alpha subunit